MPFRFPDGAAYTLLYKLLPFLIIGTVCISGVLIMKTYISISDSKRTYRYQITCIQKQMTFIETKSGDLICAKISYSPDDRIRR